MEKLGMIFDRDAISGKCFLITGDTGFKGAWLCRLLTRLDAQVVGIGLPLESDPCLFDLMHSTDFVEHHTVDIRDTDKITAIVENTAPDFVIHMAAQALVQRGFREPAKTFSVNVMGTVTILEAVAKSRIPPAGTLIVTSDKVYKNDESGRHFDEDEPLGGEDPYSASKAAAEHVVVSMRTAYPDCGPLLVARAGNVIGGGDWAANRLIPDFYQSLCAGTEIALRNPDAVRPWQHVLDVLNGYLVYLTAVARPGAPKPETMNFGPGEDATLPTVREVVEILGQAMIDRADVWVHDKAFYPPESTLLRLDTSRARNFLGWSTKLDQSATISWTADWYQAFKDGVSATELVDQQIDLFLANT